MGERTMIVPVTVHYRDIEEVCYYDTYERGVICDDLQTFIEIDAEDVQFEYADIQAIVDLYLDDVLDVILSDKRYRDALFKKLSRRKNNVSSISRTDGENNAKR